MSAIPESFLDTMDADVEVSDVQPEQSPDKASVSPPSEGNVRTEQKSTTEVDSVKDKIDPAKPDDKAEKVVPLRALQEEREAAKELKRQIADLQAQPKLTAEDAELLKELKAQKAAQAAPKDVDFMEDPKGYVDAKVQSALDKLKAVDTKAEAANSTVTQQQQHNALLGVITAHEQPFVRENPDYYAALEHVRSVRKTQLRLIAPEATDVQIDQAVNQEELRAAQAILSRGQNPCKLAYELAKTYGYAKKVPPAELPKKEEVDKSAARTMGAGGGNESLDDEMDDNDPNAEFKAVKAAFKGKR